MPREWTVHAPSRGPIRLERKQRFKILESVNTSRGGTASILESCFCPREDVDDNCVLHEASKRWDPPSRKVIDHSTGTYSTDTTTAIFGRCIYLDSHEATGNLSVFIPFVTLGMDTMHLKRSRDSDVAQ